VQNAPPVVFPQPLIFLSVLPALVCVRSPRLAGFDFLLPPVQQTACFVPLAIEFFGPLLLALECSYPPALKFEFSSFDFFPSSSSVWIVAGCSWSILELPEQKAQVFLVSIAFM
jgi:hypothetical protein